MIDGSWYTINENYVWHVVREFKGEVEDTAVYNNYVTGKWPTQEELEHENNFVYYQTERVYYKLKGQYGGASILLDKFDAVVY